MKDLDQHIKIHDDLEQGTDEWLAARCGLLTASEVKLIMTPTLKTASNDKSRAHVYELAAQRITQYVEPHYISDDMLRGMTDEVDARLLYEKECAPVTTCGFITNSKWGFTLGYSPDGLVGDDGLIECKSRRQKYQVQTVVEHIALAKGATIPADYLLQHQTGLLVSEREWIDFISYCGGMPMVVIRVYPDEQVQQAILEVAEQFENDVQATVADFQIAAREWPRAFPTERKIYEDIIA